MRYVRGHADLLELPHLLQNFALTRTQGYLTVARGKERQTLHLGPTGLRLVSSTLPRVKRLSRLARRALKASVSAARLQSILRKEKLLGWSLGHLALSPDGVRREEVVEALRKQVEEEVLDLFVWSKAMFDFREGRLTKGRSGDPLAGLPLEGPVTSLLLEAARREDEVRALWTALGDDRLQLRRVATEIHADRLGEDLQRVDAILPLVKNWRMLKSVLRASIYPMYSTLRAVHKLLELGYVEAKGRRGAAVVLAPPAAEPAVPAALPAPSAN